MLPCGTGRLVEFVSQSCPLQEFKREWQAAEAGAQHARQLKDAESEMEKQAGPDPKSLSVRLEHGRPWRQLVG